jgi:hypothetical protein
VNGPDLNGAPFRKVLESAQVSNDFFFAEVDEHQGAGVALLDSGVAEELVAIGGAVDELGVAKQDGLVLSQVGLNDLKSCLLKLCLIWSINVANIEPIEI